MGVAVLSNHHIGACTNGVNWVPLSDVFNPKTAFFAAAAAAAAVEPPKIEAPVTR